MTKGDKFELFGHEMEVLVRKETLDVSDEVPKDLFIYDLACTCHNYPKQLTMSVTQETLELMSVLNGFNEK